MANKSKRDAEWANAKRVCRLNAETVRMAKELGLSPRSLMKNVPGKSQPWKAPVQVWVRDLYEAMQQKAKQRKAREQAHQVDQRATGDDPSLLYDVEAGSCNSVDNAEEIPF